MTWRRSFFNPAAPIIYIAPIDPDDPVTCSCELPDPDGLGECRACRRLVVATVAIAASGSPAAVPAGAGCPEAAFGVAVAKADGPATAAPSSA